MALPPQSPFAARGQTRQLVCAAMIGAALNCVLTVSADSVAAKLPPPAERPVAFATDIQPLFERSCLRCHGAERPKGRFRLDNRASALQGGSHGPAIAPGDSARSALIVYVARLDPEMAMPPEGKGTPLTSEEVALLRAWIDQGAAWSGETSASYSFNATPVVGFVSVQGNAAKFREHQWLRDGWRGGLESFEFTERLSPETKLSVTGRALLEDYRVAGLLEKADLGFLRFGFEQFRKYDADTGGFVPGLGNSIYQLDRDLHLDTGRAWLDLGLTLPDWPRLVLGYEYQFRSGEKSTLQWGPVGALPPDDPSTEARNIFPAFKAVDEHTHVLKFDAEFARGGWQLADSFRGEWTESQTRRENVHQLVFGAPDTIWTDTAREGWHAFQGANTLRVEREFRDWLRGSAGYLYSHLSADADFRLDTLNPAGGGLFPGVVDSLQWRSQRIVLERESHVSNLNLLLGPSQGGSLTFGVQSEWTRQNGTAEGFYDVIYAPDFPFPLPPDAVSFIADLDKAAVDESVSLRFTRLPFTTVFAEARLQQMSIGHRENVTGEHTFDRDSDAETRSQDWRAGFDSSPRSWLKFGSHYRYVDRRTTFDDGFADGEPLDVFGYPTFITALERASHEVESRLTLRPNRWLTTTLTHRLLATDYHTTTESLTQDATGDLSPGGRVLAGDYDAQILSFNTTLTPWRRLHCFTTLSYQDTRTRAMHDRSDAVVPYRGDTWSLLCHGRYVLTETTDLTAGYSFSRADFRQENFASGLPVGIAYDLHGLQAGLVSRCARNATLKLQYGFYHYTEPSSGHVNDYEAHAILAAMTWRLP